MSAAPESIFRSINRLLKLAVVGGVEVAVQLHIDRGDDLNARDDRGQTPLMLAAARNRARICGMLIAAGADASARDASGKDALFIALAAGAAESAAQIRAALGARLRQGSPHQESIVYASPVVTPAIREKPAESSDEQTGDIQPACSPATKRESGAVTGRLAPMGAPTGTASTAPVTADTAHPDEPDFAIDEDSLPIDLSGWDAEDDSPAPDGDATLADAPTALHRAISLHEPIDDSADWSDFEGFLPTHAAPLPQAESAAAAAELRALLLRAIREGSVPSIAVDDLGGVLLEAFADAPMSPLRYVITDLGAQTDERFEYRAPHENFEVYTDLTETADEESAIDEALCFLAELEARQNDPMRLYMREVQRRSLIVAHEEIELAKTMESESQQAIDALAEWPLGLSRLFAAVEMARAGAKSVSSIVASPREDAGPEGAAAGQYGDATLATRTEISGEPDGLIEADNAGEPVDASLFDKVVNLRCLFDVGGSGDGAHSQFTDALHALSLSRPFLLQLADSALGDSTEAAKRFLAATRRIGAARDRLAGANLRLVLSIAKRYLFSGILMDDLIQEGNIGLLKAVDRFDWRRGFKFSTMATWWIRQRISRSVSDSALAIRLPAHFRDEVVLIERATKDLEKSLGHMPSIEQLASSLGMKRTRVEVLQRATSIPLSIDELDAEYEGAGEFGSEPFEPLDAAQLGEALAGSLDELEGRQAKIIRLRFGIGLADSCTLEEVGQLLNVTRERIRQIEAKAMRRLMHPTRSDRLRPWLDKDSPEEKITNTSKSVAHGMVINGTDALPAEALEASAADVAADFGDHHDSDALSRLLARACDMGIDVEHTGTGITQATWVKVGQARNNQTRSLVRKLLAMGFLHWPGQGYWK